MTQFSSFNQQIQESIIKHWNLPALSDYQVATLHYKDVARKIEKLHIIFQESGLQKGDRIALCGKNSASWGTAFFAVITYGAVAVPILHEFKPEQVHHIVCHSDAKLLFLGENIWSELDAEQMPKLDGVISMNDYTLFISRSEKLTYARQHLNELFGKKFPNNFRQHHLNYHQDQAEELALINYTSGTTSNSKGVMIPYRALWSNTTFAIDVLSEHIKAKDSIIAMLPMAHMYGMAFEFLFEFISGIHINFLTRTPSPQVLFGAFADVKPGLVVAVPLIIERVIRKAVLPKLEKPLLKLLLKLPVVSDKIRAKIREQVADAFGGRYYEVIVGGAAFNQEIEQFLQSINFNYTVGYGTTECAPIICYRDWKTFVPGSCGQPAPRMEVKIDSADPENVVGEILCRGMNVMLGYYKNPEATAQAIDADGWYHTGDLGVMDSDNNVFIKGRNKNMLLSANGQNVYPEEIEDKLNNLPLVSESIMIQKGEKFYALIYPDYEDAARLELKDEDIVAVMEENRKEANKLIPKYAQLTGVKIYKEEFEKTPKKSIKRFMYADAEV